uniref:Charged multivesicular body protein 4b n=1 Tax=Solanum tuberosum TaxID=4113 RepID=M1B308_SOLTU
MVVILHQMPSISAWSCNENDTRIKRWTTTTWQHFEANCCTFSFNVVSFTWFILHVLGEPIDESSILSVVGKASGKQGRDMRKRLNVITLLVLKAADRKFIDIVLKNIAHLLIFALDSKLQLPRTHVRLPAHKQKMSSYRTITYLRTTKSLCQKALNVSWNPGTSSGHLPLVDNPSTSSWRLPQTLEMLEKKEKVLLKKAAAEVEKAKEFTRAKNKREFDDSSNQFLLFLAAIQCLKRKRLYEQQIEQLGNFQLRIHDQMIMLEGAKATTETVDALRTGAAAMKAMQKATNIDDVDKTMDEINEQTENMKLIQEALSTPIGSAADFDEDELEAELEELEGAELEEQLLQPATTAPNAPINLPAGRQQVRPAAQKTEEDELAALQAEMAL